ncbi:MAG: Wzt carbohydrate-binding domain-containing protein, partial [Gemmataceae bacterium]|nr:Wzt carbohydrate-binding domain-containing protein [Gemmataceae bacterium]
GQPMHFELSVDVPAEMVDLRCGICIADSLGTRLFSISTTLSTSVLPPLVGCQRLVCSLADLPLVPGQYSLSVNGGPPYQGDSDVIENAACFEVIEGDYYGNGRLPNAAWGQFLVRSEWSAHKSETYNNHADQLILAQS